MKLVIISPEQTDSRESGILGELFAAGLERYHLRKPAWLREQIEDWLRALPANLRSRIVVHQHHELVDALGLGGRHWRDDGSSSVTQHALPASEEDLSNRSVASRSCHDIATLRAALGHYDSVFFGPVFSSVSKPGYGPSADFVMDDVSTLLATRTRAERRTRVLALGGITAETAPRALALGFDGVAALGAIWQAVDPVCAFVDLQSSLVCHAT